MKFTKLLYLLLFIFLCGTSCRKDSEDIQILLGSYKPQGPMQLNGGPIMYTRNGAITDVNIINEFVSRRVGSNAYRLISTDLPMYGPPYTLNFLENGLVNYTITSGFGGTFLVNARISHQTTGEVTITQLDSVHTTFSLAYGCSNLSRLVTGFNNISTCRDFSTVTECKYLPFFKLTTESGHLYQNMLTYIATNMTPNLLSFPGQPQAFNVCSSMTYSTPDNFDPGIHTQFAQGDTIVIQRKKVRFVKQ